MRLLFEELTRDEIRTLAPNTMALLPVGAMEQHGPHLPVGTDSFTVEYIARTAAAKLAADVPVLVAPTLPFGSSHHHLPFSGMLSLGTETCYRVLSDIAESLIIDGFRRIFILNGHGGNNELIQLVARDLTLKHPVHIAAASYWTIAWDGLVKEDAHVGAGLPGHSGRFETSLMLALRPDLVREPRPHRDAPTGSDPRSFYSPYRAELHGSWQHIDGFTDSPDQGRADIGARYLATIVGSVAHALMEFNSMTQ